MNTKAYVRMFGELADKGELPPDLYRTLLDEIAGHVRLHLGMDAQPLPLVKVLEAGTWFAGRRLAADRRPGGGPPITVESDGTVF